MPRSGLPDRLRSWDDYRQITSKLINAKVIDSPSKIWWDLRPSEKFPTLEMRVTDVCLRMQDAISIAALFVSLCRMLYRLRRNNQSRRDYPTMLLQENRWRAQRYGVNGTLFDLGVIQLVSFSRLMGELIDLTREDCEELDCVQEANNARQIAQDGTSADRQVRVFETALQAATDRQNALFDVVDDLIALTCQTAIGSH